MIPIKVQTKSPRLKFCEEQDNTNKLYKDLELLGEARNETRLKIAQRSQQVERFFNKKLKVRTFREGDLVLRKVFQNTKDPGAENLNPLGKDPIRWVQSVGKELTS